MVSRSSGPKFAQSQEGHRGSETLVTRGSPISTPGAPLTECRTMPEPLPPPLPGARCVYCHKAIHADDTYCRHCGRRQGAGDAWYYDSLWIAFLAFVAIGPFALILVWKSTRMGPAAKYILATLILIYTAITGYYFYILIAIILEQMADLDEVMRRF